MIPLCSLKAYMASKIEKEFADAVKAAIGDNREHGWGVEDSAEVIETLIAAEMPEGIVPSDELMKHVRKVINPSAFRQQLEKAKRPDGKTVLAPGSKRERVRTALNLFINE